MGYASLDFVLSRSLGLVVGVLASVWWLVPQTRHLVSSYVAVENREWLRGR